MARTVAGEDQTTAFQVGFYRNLASGLSPAAKQQACARGEMGDNMTDPRAWAYYVLYGAG
jgi:hypothetical protein